MKKTNYRVNEQIKENEIRVIGADGSQLGIMSSNKAMAVAEEEGLDLVEIAPKATPPVCRIINFSKFRYEQEKKEKDAKKKQKIINVKEIRLRPNIEEHDLSIKINFAIKFLLKGDKVKFNMRFKGRQNAYTESGIQVLEQIGESLSEYGKVEKNINAGKRIFVLEVTPASEKQ